MFPLILVNFNFLFNVESMLREVLVFVKLLLHNSLNSLPISSFSRSSTSYMAPIILRKEEMVTIRKVH